MTRGPAVPNSHSRGVTGSIAMTLVASAAVVGWNNSTPATATPPVPAHPVTYVALGDSYASGEGLGGLGSGYESGTNRSPSNPRVPDIDANMCHRSIADSYGSPRGARIVLPNVPARERMFGACSGATSADMTPIPGVAGHPPTAPGKRPVTDKTYQSGQPWQTSLITSETRWVSISAGGNDVEFSTIGAACAAFSVAGIASYAPGGSGNKCTAALNKAQRMLDSTTDGTAANKVQPRLQILYTKLLKDHPRVKLAVVGYPAVVPAADYSHALGINAKNKVCVTNKQTYKNVTYGVGLKVGDAKRADADVIKGLNKAATAAVKAVAKKYPGRIEFADTYAKSVPHDCDGYRQGVSVNGVMLAAPRLGQPQWILSTATFHPTKEGQKVMAGAVQEAFARLADDYLRKVGTTVSLTGTPSSRQAWPGPDGRWLTTVTSAYTPEDPDNPNYYPPIMVSGSLQSKAGTKAILLNDVELVASPAFSADGSAYMLAQTRTNTAEQFRLLRLKPGTADLRVIYSWPDLGSFPVDQYPTSLRVAGNRVYVHTDPSQYRHPCPDDTLTTLSQFDLNGVLLAEREDRPNCTTSLFATAAGPVEVSPRIGQRRVTFFDKATLKASSTDPDLAGNWGASTVNQVSTAAVVRSGEASMCGDVGLTTYSLNGQQKSVGLTMALERSEVLITNGSWCNWRVIGAGDAGWAVLVTVSGPRAAPTTARRLFYVLSNGDVSEVDLSHGNDGHASSHIDMVSDRNGRVAISYATSGTCPDPALTCVETVVDVVSKDGKVEMTKIFGSGAYTVPYTLRGGVGSLAIFMQTGGNPPAWQSFQDKEFIRSDLEVWTD